MSSDQISFVVLSLTVSGQQPGRQHAFRKHSQQAEDELLIGAGVPRPQPAQQPHGQGAHGRNVRQPEGQGDSQRIHPGRRHPDRR